MTVRILTGDCRDVVTSPPYFGLRDYKIPPSLWGGGESCALALTHVDQLHPPRSGTAP
jgi:hypothetical protein